MPRSPTLSKKTEPPASSAGAGDHTGDLTQILDYGKKLEEKGLFPKLGSGSGQGEVFHEEPHREKLEVFQDLTELGPMDHPDLSSLESSPQESDFQVSSEIPNTEPTPPFNLDLNEDFNSNPETPSEISATELENQFTTSAPVPLAEPEPFVEVALNSPLMEPVLAPSPPEFHEQVQTEWTPPAAPIVPDVPVPAFEPSASKIEGPTVAADVGQIEAKFELTTLQTPVLRSPEKAPTLSPSQPGSRRVLEKLTTEGGNETLFSIQIDGPLSLAERNRLEDFLRKEQLGIQPEDLRLQFETGHLWLPRLSEYAVVLLVQQLRTTSAEIRVSASSEQSGSVEPELEYQAVKEQDQRENHDALPDLLSGPPPTGTVFENLGIYSATALIPIDGVTAQLAGPSASDAYSNAVRRIETEIQKRAQSKGAELISDFKLSWEALTPAEAGVLSSALDGRRYNHGAWKITGIGSARRAKR